MPGISRSSRWCRRSLNPDSSSRELRHRSSWIEAYSSAHICWIAVFTVLISSCPGSPGKWIAPSTTGDPWNISMMGVSGHFCCNSRATALLTRAPRPGPSTATWKCNAAQAPSSSLKLLATATSNALCSKSDAEDKKPSEVAGTRSTVGRPRTVPSKDFPRPLFRRVRKMDLLAFFVGCR